ncbi:uncharacterized protein LOC115634030 isoform X2 [Scaptodrosophila lebanonensis]|uniref:Uncharacterized protein LOC115634030 isoform X2 n=1 Tax=Drosophila lebanonensis TaxID=7225 RepID=A0A6J2UH38_DROLE|nr:uncharacterized protein LOC115634030 isoform X2 [Scaptodrosophila lebanonensis]
MSEPRKLKCSRYVRLADVLYDEQGSMSLLCRSCHRQFLNMNVFQQHVKKCAGIGHIVTPTEQLVYDESMCERKQLNGTQELLIYDIDAVKSADDHSTDFDWTAELDDPRWYTDQDIPTASTLPVLPIAKSKTGPVHAKENLARTRSVRQEANKAQHMSRERTSGQKRTNILISQQQRKSCDNSGPSENVTKAKETVYIVPNVVADLRRLQTEEVCSHSEATTIKSVGANQSATLAPSNTSKDTQQILNKLRACGVEVKRRNTSKDKPAVHTDGPAATMSGKASDEEEAAANVDSSFGRACACNNK